MTSFIDTHCHLDMLELSVEEALALAQEQQVSAFLTISVDVDSLHFVQTTSQQYDCVFGSLGIHPHDAIQYNDMVSTDIATMIQQNSKILAIGETGLDYHYMKSPKQVQQSSFIAQLELAEQLQMPLILHTREAEEDTMQILRNYPISKKGVAHSFTGSTKMGLELIDMGWYIGFNGIVTFRKAEEVRNTLHAIPRDRILLETDAPFLTPVPLRGKPNDPSKIPLIADYISKELDWSLTELITQTSHNANQLFQFSKTIH